MKPFYGHSVGWIDEKHIVTVSGNYEKSQRNWKRVLERHYSCVVGN